MHQATLPPDTYAVPIILYSDKTSVTPDCRTSMWPVSMTVGNIDLKQRSQQHGSVLRETIPATLSIGKKGAKDYVERLAMYHECMNYIFESLKVACQG